MKSAAGRKGRGVQDQPPGERSRSSSVTQSGEVSDGGDAVFGERRGAGVVEGGAMGPSPRRRPSGSFAGGAGGSSPRGVSLRRRPSGSSNGGAAGFVPVMAHSPRRRPAGLTDGGAEGSGTVRQASGLRGRGEVSGPVGGEVPMGERSEDTCCFCDFRGREGRCGAVAVDLLPAVGAVVDGIRQEGWHWCPNHAWRSG